MNKKIKTLTVTQKDYIIRDVTDEELDIRGHLSQFIEYDREGHIVKEIKYDRMGHFEDMHLFTYDEKGLPLSESYFPEAGQEAEKTTFEHNESGTLMQSRKQYLDGSIDIAKYFYDTTNRLIKKVTTSDDEEPEEEVFEKFENETEADTGNEDGSEFQVTRNEKGQIIKEEVFSENKELLTCVDRRYDEDNLAEVEVFIDGQGKTITRHYILEYEYVFFENPD